MQPQEHPYQFIVDSNHKGKKPLLQVGDSKKARIMVVAGGLLVLIILAMIVSALISAASNAGKAEVVKAAQHQSELVRISKLGLQRAKGISAQNLASTTYLSLMSDQATLTASLKASGVKVSPKELALGKDPKTDILLNNAEQANRFDEVFIQTIQSELVEYQKILKTAHDKASSEKLKATLATQFTNAGLLAKAKQ